MKRILFVIAVLVLAMSFIASSSAQPKPPWTKTLTAKPHNSRTWRSPVKFGPKQTVYVGFYVGKFSLPVREVTHCILYADGNGVHVRLNICGDHPVPLRVRYEGTGDHSVTFRVVYQL